MKRILLCGVGSLGDHLPLVQLGRHLQNDGLKILYAAEASAVPLAKWAGLSTVVLPSNSARSRTWSGSSLRAARLEYSFRSYPAHAPVLKDVLREIDLAVVTPLGSAAASLADAAGVPWATVAAVPSLVPSSEYMPLYRPHRWSGRAACRAAWKLRLLADRSYFAAAHVRLAPFGPSPGAHFAAGAWSKSLTCVLASQPLFPDPQDWPQTTRLTGFVLPDWPFPWSRSTLNAFAEKPRPRLLVTFGSTGPKVDSRSVFAALAELTRLGWAVAVVGDGATAVPAGVMQVGFVSLREAAASADVILHHGGTGTLGTVLAAAKPSLILPVAFDQVANARRAEALGVAATLPLTRTGASELVRAITTVSEDPTYTESAIRHADSITVDCRCERIRAALQEAYLSC